VTVDLVCCSHCTCWCAVHTTCWCAVRTARVGVLFTLHVLVCCSHYTCWCAVHTVYAVRLRTAVLEPRIAASDSRAAGCCWILSLSLSLSPSPSPYRHHFTVGAAHYVSRTFCSSFASLKTNQHVFEEKEQNYLSAIEFPPPSWRL
jgi:hypothetical protein